MTKLKLIFTISCARGEYYLINEIVKVLWISRKKYRQLLANSYSFDGVITKNFLSEEDGKFMK